MVVVRGGTANTEISRVRHVLVTLIGALRLGGGSLHTAHTTQVVVIVATVHLQARGPSSFHVANTFLFPPVAYRSVSQVGGDEATSERTYLHGLHQWFC